MKSIGTKLFAVIGVFTIIFSAFVLFRTYTVSNQYINELVTQQADLALQFDLSIRKYVADEIRPLMYELVGEDEFIPESMSTSFVARSIFDDVRKTFPEFILKFSSKNPRNPANMAGPEELEIIDYFNKHPSEKTPVRSDKHRRHAIHGRLRGQENGRILPALSRGTDRCPGLPD